jgi:hypothetical protein
MNHPRSGLAAACQALAGLGPFAGRLGLRRQTLTSALTPSKGAPPADRRSRIRGGRLTAAPSAQRAALLGPTLLLQ